MVCSKCGEEVLEDNSFCRHCGVNLSTDSADTQRHVLSSGLTIEEFRAFVGKNADKYLPKFIGFNEGGTDSFKATWHWPAFLFPFFWMLYRKLYGWAVLAFFLMFLSLSGLITGFPWTIPTGFVWAIFAYRLYYNHAKKKLLAIKQQHPSPEAQKAVIVSAGGVGKAVPYVMLAPFIVIGICYAFHNFVLPSPREMQERARKSHITRRMAPASEELQIWVDSSVKGRQQDRGLREARELDTDDNGIINNDDMTNAELLKKGVCNQYISIINSEGRGGEQSPWFFDKPLWSKSDGNGQIQCMQMSDDSITLIGRDKDGAVLDKKTITAQQQVIK